MKNKRNRKSLSWFVLLCLVILCGCQDELPNLPDPGSEVPEQPVEPSEPEKTLTLQDVLGAIPAISDTTWMMEEEGANVYECIFRQPLDQFGESSYHLPQRIVIHFVSFDAPTVLMCSGYSLLYERCDVSRMLNANQIEVEYRYHGQSIPDGNYPDAAWSYLDSRQASADLHAIYEAFKPYFNSQWISTGVSKGGVNTAFYALFHPGDMDLYVPFAAPFFTSLEDERVGQWINNGVATTEVREQMIQFIRMALRRKEGVSRALPIVSDIYQGYDEEELVSFMPYLIFSTFLNRLAYEKLNLWSKQIPTEQATDAQLAAFILGDDQWKQRETLLKLKSVLTKSLVEEISDNPYYPQALKELGFYRMDLTPYAKELAEGLLTEQDALFWPYVGTAREQELLLPRYSNETTLRFLNEFLPTTTCKMIFVYGQNDYWTGAAIEEYPSNPNIQRFILPDVNHSDHVLSYPRMERYHIQQAIEKALAD